MTKLNCVSDCLLAKVQRREFTTIIVCLAAGAKKGRGVGELRRARVRGQRAGRGLSPG